jgi:hypothetical protein
MPTPTQLETFATDKGWSYRQLAEEISRATGISVTLDTVRRFCNGIGRPARLTAAAIDKYWAAQTAKPVKAKRSRHSASRSSSAAVTS